MRESADVSTEPRGRSPVADAAPIPLTARRAERPPIAEDETADEITAITAMSSGIAAALAFERAERAAPSAPPAARARATRIAWCTATGAAAFAASTAASGNDGEVSSGMSSTRAGARIGWAAGARATVGPLRGAITSGCAGLTGAAGCDGGAVTARALGPDGLRAGEVEAMVVGVAQVTDLAALFTE